MHGDRLFGDDPAIVCGGAFLEGRPVMVVGEQKGRDTKQKLHRNFGMPKPEGYRKALRVMQLASKFNRPVITLLDTPGAYPGIDAEERGQAEAIARSTEKSLSLGVANVAVIIGEGGSGGAIAIATCNRVLMLEHAIYSVASPEASASILWRDTTKAQEAATSMKITAQDLLRFGLIDGIIQEPVGGAHRDPTKAIAATGEAIASALEGLGNLSPDAIREARADKFLAMGRKG
jgi:acetyl-CoA carboxylase carboxyl transferase subunit alpha